MHSPEKHSAGLQRVKSVGKSRSNVPRTRELRVLQRPVSVIVSSDGKGLRNGKLKGFKCLHASVKEALLVRFQLL